MAARDDNLRAAHQETRAALTNQPDGVCPFEYKPRPPVQLPNCATIAHESPLNLIVRLGDAIKRLKTLTGDYNQLVTVVNRLLGVTETAQAWKQQCVELQQQLNDKQEELDHLRHVYAQELLRVGESNHANQYQPETPTDPASYLPVEGRR